MTEPKFKSGDRVHIAKIDACKTIVGPEAYGSEWRYVLRDDGGALDEGWREDELELVASLEPMSALRLTQIVLEKSSTHPTILERPITIEIGGYFVPLRRCYEGDDGLVVATE